MDQLNTKKYNLKKGYKATEDMLEYGRQYRIKNLKKLQQQQRDYYVRHKSELRELKKERRIYTEPDIEKRLKLIEKIESQGGNVDFLDCLRIIDCYTEVYGDRGKRIDMWDSETQIIYMYHKIKTFKLDTTKICSTCKRDLDLNCFSINNNTTCGYHSRCKECCNRIAEEKKQHKKEYDKEYHKTHPRHREDTRDRREYHKKWREKNPNYYRDRERAKK